MRLGFWVGRRVHGCGHRHHLGLATCLTILGPESENFPRPRAMNAEWPKDEPTTMRYPYVSAAGPQSVLPLLPQRGRLTGWRKRPTTISSAASRQPGRCEPRSNYGNIVLALKGPDGEPAGISCDLARELRSPASTFRYRSRSATRPARSSMPERPGGLGRGLPGHRSEAAPDDCLHRALRDHRGGYIIPKASPHLENDQSRHARGSGSRSAEARPMTVSRAPLKSAERVFAPTSQAGRVSCFRQDGLDAVASVRQPLEIYARDHSDVRVLPGRFMVIEPGHGRLERTR